MMLLILEAIELAQKIESTVLKINQINECCAISVLDDLEGFAIYLFVVSKK